MNLFQAPQMFDVQFLYVSTKTYRYLKRIPFNGYTRSTHGDYLELAFKSSTPRGMKNTSNLNAVSHFRICSFSLTSAN